MATIAFKRATKTQSKLRMAIDGPSGSGKTYTALTFAFALAGSDGTVAVIDTERGSASKYAGNFPPFDVLELDTYSPKHYIEGIAAAEDAGYAVLVIDSLSHAWEGEGGVLDLHDQATRRQSGGNSFTAWRDVTPLHRQLIDAMLQSRCHIIATMRSKMDYIQTQDDKGRTTIKKVGLAPVQRQGMEYEFDIVADMDQDHNLVVSKSRCFEVADAVVNKPAGKWFAPVLAWLSDGAAAPAQAQPQEQPQPEPEQPQASDWTKSEGERAAFAKWRSENVLTDADCKRLAAAALKRDKPLEFFRDYPGNRLALQKAIMEQVAREAAR